MGTSYPVHPSFPTSITVQPGQPSTGTSLTGQIYYQPVLTNTIVTQPVIATIQQQPNQDLNGGSSNRTEPQIITVKSEMVKDVTTLDDIQNIHILPNVIVPPLLISQDLPLRKESVTIDNSDSSGRKESTISTKSFSSQASDNVQFIEPTMPVFQPIPEQYPKGAAEVANNDLTSLDKKSDVKDDFLSNSQTDGHSEISQQEFPPSSGQDNSYNVESSQSTSPDQNNMPLEKPKNLADNSDFSQASNSPDNQLWDNLYYDSQPITPIADYQNFDYPKDNPDDQGNAMENTMEMMDKEETKLERTESSKSRKSSMIKRKSRPFGPKLSVLSLTGSTIECQLETSKHQTVTFTFETGDAVPADIANNLVNFFFFSVFYSAISPVNDFSSEFSFSYSGSRKFIIGTTFGCFDRIGCGFNTATQRESRQDSGFTRDEHDSGRKCRFQRWQSCRVEKTERSG